MKAGLKNPAFFVFFPLFYKKKFAFTKNRFIMYTELFKNPAYNMKI